MASTVQTPSAVDTGAGARVRAGLNSSAARATLLAVSVAAAACGAPASRPARGPVADAVQTALETGTDPFGHEEWDRLVAAGAADDGLVDYPLFQRRQGELDAYLRRVAEVDLAALAPSHLEALLINAYNALTIRTILEHPEVASIRDIDGVWTDIRHQVGGYGLTLDEIEHNLLRPFFKDPRIHFAVNCASRSCAPLPRRAFTGEALGTQLEERSRAFLSDPQHVRVEAGTLLLSRYFDWYGEDFTRPDWSPRAETGPLFVAGYTRPEVATFIRQAGGRPPVTFLDYDWSLNAAVPPDPTLASGPAARPATAAEEGPITRLRRWIVGLGPWGAAVYAVAYVLLTVFFVPAWPMTVGAGAAYGLLLGTVIVSVSSVTGAAAAFLVARYLLRARVERWVADNDRFRAIDRAVGVQGWKIVALTRLSPVFPFNLQNYAYGLTAVGFWPYVLASWLAMLPGTVLYVYIGAIGAETAAAATGTVDWVRAILQWIGFGATVVVTLQITRIARRALKQTAGDMDAARGNA